MIQGSENIHLPDFNIEKTIEATAYLLQLYGINRPVKFMRILKLLYLSDRRALEIWERPITYDRYISMKFGQVLSNTYDLMKREKINDLWDRYIEHTLYYWISLKDPIKLNKLSPAEVELLSQIYDEHGEDEEFDLAKKTHDLPEYVDPGDSSVTTSLDNLLRSLNYSEEDIERILSELQSEAIVDSIISA